MDGQNLSGQLSDWSINDLLQIMQVTNKTGSLDINGTQRGRVHFRSGAVTGAELWGRNGGHEGTERGDIADIIYVLSMIDEGSFSVGPADGPETDGYAVEEIVKEVDVLRSLEDDVVGSGLLEAPSLCLTADLDKPITLEPADWQALADLVQPFNFDQLETDAGRGGAIRIFHTLLRLGVAETVDDEQEAEFLDRLADGLATDSSEPTWLEQIPDAPVEEEAPPAEPVAAAVEVPEPAQHENVADETESVDDSPEPEVEPAEADDVAAPVLEPVGAPEPAEADPEDVKGVSAPASTTLTDGVYDEIRRLRSKVAER